MQEWIDWLNRRGVANAVIQQFGLSAGTHSPMGSCIVIPVLDEHGEFSFNKYRRSPLQGDVKPKYLYDKGSHALLYGADKIKDSPRVLITEGELDCLVAWSAHIPAVSSTGGAGTFLPEWAELLVGKDITICFDNDSAGGAGMVRALGIVPGASILFLPDRPGVKDITDYVAGGGDLAELMRSRVRFDGLQDVIDDRAVRLSLWQSTHFHDAYIAAHTVPTFVRTERRAVGSDMDEITRAKAYPIGELVKFNREHKALCIWHKEKSPSLHYYAATNSVYCFGGCGKGGDAIDVYRQLNSCSFAEAIRALL